MFGRPVARRVRAPAECHVSGWQTHGSRTAGEFEPAPRKSAGDTARRRLCRSGSAAGSQSVPAARSTELRATGSATDRSQRFLERQAVTVLPSHEDGYGLAPRQFAQFQARPGRPPWDQRRARMIQIRPRALAEVVGKAEIAACSQRSNDRRQHERRHAVESIFGLRRGVVRGSQTWRPHCLTSTCLTRPEIRRNPTVP